MAVAALELLYVLGILVALRLAWQVLEWGWLSPRRLGRALRSEGLRGTAYRFPAGDAKDGERLLAAARSKPMPSLSHAISARVEPLVHNAIHEHGKYATTLQISVNLFMVWIWSGGSLCSNFFAWKTGKTSGKISMVWFGPTPQVILNDPKLVREVLSNKFGHFQKPKLPSHFIKLIAQGLTAHEGEKWALHRKIINPAFHLEKLKVMNGPTLSANISEIQIKALSSVTVILHKYNGCLN